MNLPGFTWSDLHHAEKLAELTAAFVRDLEQADPQLAREFQAYRENPEALPPTQAYRVLLKTAHHVSRFIAHLFGVSAERQDRLEQARPYPALARFKKDFVQRRVVKKIKSDAIDAAEFARGETLARAVLGAFPEVTVDGDEELSVARVVDALLDLETAEATGATRDRLKALRTATGLAAEEGPALVREVLGGLERWVAGLSRHRADGAKDWLSLTQPAATTDAEHLVELTRPRVDLGELILSPEELLTRRVGFNLTDPRWDRKAAMQDTFYCLLCAERGKDTCSHGLWTDTGDAAKVKQNALGVEQRGCPLEQKISEMHALKRLGDDIGALALVTIDNLMTAGTGHRICNDCMKSCVYQKQEPVNIPQIETRILWDVLTLPWGFEIYGLLTRWNPLRVRRPHPRSYTGKNTLVVGLGPAGYTLAMWLLNEGFGVVGIDGLKIERLPEEWLRRPIRSLNEIYTSLEDRLTVGFGGVAEYGITARWDKNFLTVLDLLLRRREHYRLYGGTRFGGTIRIEDAWELGFDHIAICAGAGKPTLVEMKNNLIRGVRKASDWLMALQLTGAFKRGSMANLQVRLPAVVIGGGLTAVDTATELLAFYPVQVEKVAERMTALEAERGRDAVWARFDPEEQGVLREFLEHAREIRVERERAAQAGEKPHFLPLLKRWGGVTMAYRRRMIDSPAYRLNHEEVNHGLREGIEWLENLTPLECIADRHGALETLLCRRADGTEMKLPARTLCVAAGTSPNIIYEKEHPGTFQVDRKRSCFSPHRLADDGSFRLEPAAGTRENPGFFTSYDRDGRRITYFGDNHPAYSGSVVRAMASARDGHREIVRLFARELAALAPSGQPERERHWREFATRLDDLLVPRVHEVKRLNAGVVEIVVRAPMQARRFEAGQFFRLQNFESRAQVIDGTRLAMEPVALTGAFVDREQGLVGLIVQELGGSTRLIESLRPQEPVVLMGPTGAPSEIPEHENVVLAGGGLGNAVLFSIAAAMRAKGNRVIYFAAYKKADDVFHRDDIETHADAVVWSVDDAPKIGPRRAQDRNFHGNVVQAMVAWSKGEMGELPFRPQDCHRILAIGSDRMMAAVTRARHEVLAPYLKPDHAGIASINTPMQCMMKEVCGQCLVRHIDGQGKPKAPVFSCFNQDQHMDHVDWANLNARLRQTSVLEKISSQWLDRLLAQRGRTQDPQLVSRTV